MVYRSEGSGQWPVGVHWTPGEVRDVPDDYPREGDPPPWLAPVEAKAAPEAKPPKGG